MTPSANLHASPGLTLLEVILAVTLTVALMGLVFWLYDSATGIRHDVLLQMEGAATVRRTMGRVADDLRCAAYGRFLQLSVEGETNQVRFLTSRIPGPAAWVALSLREDPPPREHDLMLVTYRLRQQENEDGELEVVGLERQTQRRPTAQTVEDVEGSQDVETALLTSQVKFLRLAYYDGAEWAPSWNQPRMPVAVEIAFGGSPLPEGVSPDEYPYELTSRIVPLPADPARIARSPRGGGSGGEDSAASGDEGSAAGGDEGGVEE